MRPRAVIFDMDGVIVLTEEQHAKAEQLACKAYGIEISPEEWVRFKGMRNPDMFSLIVRDFAKKPISIGELVEFSRSKFLQLIAEELLLVPGVFDFLCVCRESFRSLALVTSSGRITQQHIFDRLNIAANFDLIITGDQIVNGKPHPEPYLTAAHRLGLLPKECVVIEDSDNGIRSALAAGCIPIGIATSFSIDELYACGAVFAGNSFLEIQSFLGKYGSNC